ncbi:MAG: response regulator [Candidatus Aureabacteria bacterium]|nr:response regulator [Candidatus Auribacterota bacterium]
MPDKGKTDILVIDDDLAIRKTLRNFLTKAGYSIITASDGEEGIEKIKQMGIKIIICDIVLPKLEGIDFLKQAKEYSFMTEVIMITGHSSMERCVEAIEAGACGYLKKPFDLEEILKYIEKAERNINERMDLIKEAMKKKNN